MRGTLRTALLVASVLVRTASGQCLPSIASVDLRDRYTNTSVERTYSLCPDTVYQVGTFIAGNIPPFSGGDAFFLPRPNVRILCGEDGSSANNCTITGGTVQVAASTIAGTTEPPTNVVFQGFTFADTNRYSFWGDMPGDITFNDCIFRDNTEAMAPIFLDYADDSSSEELSVSFAFCQFLDNRYFGEPAYGALITGNGIQNRLVVQNSQFRGNDMVFNNTASSRSSYLIETSGPLTVDFNCFYNNTIGVAPVGSYVADVDFTLNYGEASSGEICEFMAVFETSAQFETFSPVCVSWNDPQNAASCTDSQTKTPTIPPTDYPSAVPSSEPTTMQPSNRPSVGDTDAPTVSPEPTLTPMPSMMTSPPSEEPTTLPTVGSGSSTSCTLISASAAVVLSLWML